MPRDIADFSTVEGFRLCDFDTECVTGESCPAQKDAVSLYVGNVCIEDGELFPDTSFEDRDLLDKQLSEIVGIAKAISCSGAAKGYCPAQQELRNNR